MKNEYKLTSIGIIDRGGDSKDQYVLLENFNDDIDLDHAREWLLNEAYYTTERIGSWFCGGVSIVPKWGAQAIGIIHHFQNI